MNWKSGYDAKLHTNLDPTKGVDKLRWLDDGLKSIIECVTTHLPNQLALKMDGIEMCDLNAQASRWVKGLDE